MIDLCVLGGGGGGILGGGRFECKGGAERRAVIEVESRSKFPRDCCKDNINIIRCSVYHYEIVLSMFSI